MNSFEVYWTPILVRTEWPGKLLFNNEKLYTWAFWTTLFGEKVAHAAYKISQNRNTLLITGWHRFRFPNVIMCKIYLVNTLRNYNATEDFISQLYHQRFQSRYCFQVPSNDSALSSATNWRNYLFEVNVKNNGGQVWRMKCQVSR
jgi:hypothetical protein